VFPASVGRRRVTAACLGWAGVENLTLLRDRGISARNSTGFIDFGRKCVPHMVSLRPRATAVVAGNDETAYGLWLSFRQHWIKVPDDISLVGFDDREEAILMDPQLSTVRVHKEAIGEACMKMLLERLHTPQAAFSRRILPTEIIIRGTVRRI